MEALHDVVVLEVEPEHHGERHDGGDLREHTAPADRQRGRGGGD